MITVIDSTSCDRHKQLLVDHSTVLKVLWFCSKLIVVLYQGVLLKKAGWPSFTKTLLTSSKAQNLDLHKTTEQKSLLEKHK
jgi:hypothetical protein